MPFTVREVRAARPQPKPYGVADGDGLILWIAPTGNKFWHFRYRLHGKQPRISLGRYPRRHARATTRESGVALKYRLDPSAHSNRRSITSDGETANTCPLDQ